jgi:NAD(P)-dependent dehydrogenase (short-subunit alcohol dehydrogenase family)
MSPPPAPDSSAPGPFDHNVSKVALNALTKVIAEQFGPRGVRAITVAPGPVKTQVWTDPDGMIARMAAAQGIDHETFSGQRMSMVGSSTERISTPEEVARLIAIAASPSNINGAEFLIDGGAVKSA